MKAFAKKLVLVGVLSAAAATVGCQRTYDRRHVDTTNDTAATANADYTRHATAPTDATADARDHNTDTAANFDHADQNSNADFNRTDENAAAAQSDDVNLNQDLAPNQDTAAYGGSGTAGMTDETAAANNDTAPTDDESGIGGSGKKKARMDAGMAKDGSDMNMDSGSMRKPLKSDAGM